MNFRVGQRVRIVSSRHSPHVVGREATVISQLEDGHCTWDGTHWQGYRVSIDGIGSGDKRGRFCFQPHRLEPIQPYDGNQIVSWESCLWRPEGVHA